MRGQVIIFGVLAALLAWAPFGARAAEAPELHVYNWSDYIAPDTIANFTKETGIAVTYDVYDGNEVLEAKLLAGDSGYDVVVPSASPFMAREIKAGAFLPLDKSKLPNLKNLDPAMLGLAAKADPANKFGVPYLWSVTGIGYNESLVAKALGNDRPRDTLALLFDPDNAKRLAGCGISLLDTPQEVYPAALAYLGLDPQSTDPGDLEKATALLQKIRPYVRKFHSSQYINDLANGDICIALGYSGDVIQARNRANDAKNGVRIAFRVPKEGAQFSIDMLGIPKDAPHPDNAHKLINTILRPEVIAAISDAVSYPNPNLAATLLVKPEIRNDPGIYPPPETRKLFYVDLPASRDYERARMQAWNRVKAGE
jgi:putrescine transport system substrate-binding protein